MDPEQLRLEGQVMRAEQRVTVAKAVAERYPTAAHVLERLRRAEEELKQAQSDLDRLKARPRA